MTDFTYYAAKELVRLGIIKEKKKASIWDADTDFKPSEEYQG